MAIQKNLPSVKATAFITATSNNAQDFEDAKKLFKESLQEAVKEATTQAELEIYKEAVEGFLMELEQKDSTEDSLRRLAHSLQALRAPEKELYRPCWAERVAPYIWKPLFIVSGSALLWLLIRALIQYFN